MGPEMHVRPAIDRCTAGVLRAHTTTTTDYHFSLTHFYFFISQIYLVLFLKHEFDVHIQAVLVSFAKMTLCLYWKRCQETGFHP